ncbi:SUMF1/EgtB/PvdO family nonheme iron enzyme [Bacteroidota bacterium]
MKKLSRYFISLLASVILINNTFGQNLKRDTTLFEEHQVIFEKMDYIPSERPVKLVRILNNDTAGIVVYSDPYWISSMVSNREYREYLKAIELSPVHYQTASPPNNIQSQQIEGLDIPYAIYFNNSMYDNYPVLGISWQQTNIFCQWKTRQVNAELKEANLPTEKDYRLPLSAEIEGAKHFTNINLPRAFKTDARYSDPDLIRFYSKISEWTAETFLEQTYLTELNFTEDAPNVVVYHKASQETIPYKAKESNDLSTGFRYVQTYRKVPNSK